MAGPVSQPVLTTSRLRLRPFEMRDAEPLHAFFSDPEAMRYFGDPHETLDQTRAFVSGTMAEPLATTADFIIEKDGMVIGKAGMWKAPEIGVFVLRRHHRHGYASEALSAVIPWLFEAYGFDQVVADIDPANLASLALFESLGFRVTGQRKATVEIGGVWCDSIDMALSRADWDARHASPSP